MHLPISHCFDGFGLAGLAAPQGVLGPVGTKRGRGAIRAPSLFSLPATVAREEAHTRPGPKTQSCPRAERTRTWTFGNQEGGPCNTPLYNYLGVIERS